MKKVLLAVVAASLVGCGSDSDSSAFAPQLPEQDTSEQVTPEQNGIQFDESWSDGAVTRYSVINNYINDVTYYTVSDRWQSNSDAVRSASNEIWRGHNGVSYSNSVQQARDSEFDYMHKIDNFMSYDATNEIPEQCVIIGGVSYYNIYIFSKTTMGELTSDGEFIAIENATYNVEHYQDCIIGSSNGPTGGTIIEWDDNSRSLAYAESAAEFEQLLIDLNLFELLEYASWENNRQYLDELQRDTGMDYERDIL